ncbi:Synaptic vesicle 2-related protein-like [Oopsacas minuta]|uniref:Synaptic vesicle 2-related protein-like n=1 Tax=Oopsacas minuta TaxID=111878 RepID=A0AAV7JCF2_9METZ|nr:Synaptic vesicle 2-related protein-like [Oopsacas minuta]
MESSSETILTESTESRSEEDPLLGVNHRENSSKFTVEDALNKIGIGIFQLNVFCFSGLLWSAQSIVTLQFALLSPSWQCEFQLMNTELAIITTMYPLGNLVGSFPIGFLCDKYGRRKVINIATIFIIYFALMSAFVPSFYWVVVLRFLLGMLGISGNQAATYCVEFMPVWFRSPSIVLLNIFWTFGTFLLILLCYLIIPVLGWRYLVFISAFPLMILPLYYWIVPISPRFLMLKGRKNEARKVLEFGAKLNCRKLPEGELVKEIKPVTQQAINADDTVNRIADLTPSHQNIKKEEKRGILDAFNRKYIITTIFLSLIWFTSAFVYYGVVLITTDIFTYDHHCHSASDRSNSSGSQINSQFCNPLTSSDYLEYIITSAAEIPGIFITLVIVDIIGRKLTFAIQFASGALFFLLYICTPYEYVLKTGILFTVRACLAGAFVVSFLYTGEVYPTYMRASILSILSIFARISSILTSFSAQVLLRSDFLVAISLFGGLGVFTAIISLLLPHETKGKKLE